METGQNVSLLFKDFAHMIHTIDITFNKTKKTTNCGFINICDHQFFMDLLKFKLLIRKVV